MEVNKTIKFSLFDLKSSGIQKITGHQNFREKNIPFSEKIINLKIEIDIFGKGKINNNDEVMSNEFFSSAPTESKTNRLQKLKKSTKINSSSNLNITKIFLITMRKFQS